MRCIDELSSGFGKLFLRMHRLMDRRMAKSGASFSRAKLLMMAQKEGPTRAIDMAEMFGLAPRTVTEALDGLERDGLIRREPDAIDRRVKRVIITEEGKRAIDATEPLRVEMIDRIFGRLSDEEQTQLRHIVAKLGAALDDEELRD
jgi:DNA-binding MarR family transcriptional regulator